MLKAYSVYDTIAGKFSNPIFVDSDNGDELAKRAFKAQLYDRGTMIALFPDNYELHYIGEFNELTGEFIINNLPSNLVVITGIDALNEVREHDTNEIPH